MSSPLMTHSQRHTHSALSFLRIILHALLNPRPRRLRQLVHLLRRQLGRLKRRVLVRHVAALFKARSLEQRVQPLVNVRELVQRDTSVG